MNRPVPIWLFAVLPATVAGHALAYAAAGRSMADGHHGWLLPSLECSAALLLLVCLALLGSVLVKAGLMARQLVERSPLNLWLRMAVLQTGLFLVIEHAEGTSAGLVGCAIQIAVALVAAYLLFAFARLLETCIQGTRRAAHHLQRALASPGSFLVREPRSFARALAVSAGTSRFQRPPPRFVVVFPF